MIDYERKYTYFMESWVWLVLFYGLVKGVREILKKQALKKSSASEMLFFYTLISFLITIPFSHGIFDIHTKYYFIIAIKSFVIFLGWMMSAYALKRLPVSIYSVVDMGQLIFSTLLGVIFVREVMGAFQVLGLLVVALALFLVNFKKDGDGGEVRTVYVLVTLLYCLLNSTSGLMDKLILRTGEINSSQLQFWYMLYLTVFYGANLLLSRTRVDFAVLKKNYAIPVMSVLFVAADRALFIANSNPDSRVTVMSIIKQSSVVVAVLLGRIVFREKNILYRLFCALLVIVGILITFIKM